MCALDQTLLIVWSCEGIGKLTIVILVLIYRGFGTLSIPTWTAYLILCSTIDGKHCSPTLGRCLISTADLLGCLLGSFLFSFLRLYKSRIVQTPRKYSLCHQSFFLVIVNNILVHVHVYRDLLTCCLLLSRLTTPFVVDIRSLGSSVAGCELFH